MNNLGLKAISLGLAVLLSVAVHYFFTDDQSNTSVVQLIVPVEVQNLAKDLVVIAPTTRQVEVALRGPSWSLAKIVTAPPIFRVEVPDGVRTSFSTVLRKEDLRVGSNVEVLSIRPSELEFKLDRLVERVVPVVVPRIGSSPEGLQVERLQLHPPEITLRGPESELKSITSVETLPLDLRDISESSRHALSVRVPGSLTEAHTPVVEAEVTIASKQREATFRGLVIEVRSSSGSALSVVPRNALVEVSGPEALVLRLSSRDIVPFVRIQDWPPNSGSSELPVQVDAPPGAAVIRIDPPTVQVVTSGPSSGKGAVKIAPKPLRGSK